MHLVNSQCDNAPERALRFMGEEGDQQAMKAHATCSLCIGHKGAHVS